MSQYRRSALVFLVCLSAGAGGCATGGTGGTGDDDDGSGPPDASVMAPPDAAPGLPDAKPQGPPDAMPQGAPDAAVYSCSSGATCAGASNLGSVSGDTGNEMQSIQGSQSAWYRVRVTEDNSDIFGLTLRVAAKLSSPVGADFDVFVYVNTGSDTIECSTTTGTTTHSGNVDIVKAEWGEGTISNGSDDGRWVSIEVRPVSGMCAAGQNWLLEVEGNWL